MSAEQNVNQLYDESSYAFNNVLLGSIATLICLTEAAASTGLLIHTHNPSLLIGVLFGLSGSTFSAVGTHSSWTEFNRIEKQIRIALRTEKPE